MTATQTVPRRSKKTRTPRKRTSPPKPRQRSASKLEKAFRERPAIVDTLVNGFRPVDGQCACQNSNPTGRYIDYDHYISAYAYAAAHKKGERVSSIAVDGPPRQISGMLCLGRKLDGLFKLVKKFGNDQETFHPEGILCLLGNVSAWLNKATEAERQAALMNLYNKNTKDGIYRRVRKHGWPIFERVEQIRGMAKKPQIAADARPNASTLTTGRTPTTPSDTAPDDATPDDTTSASTVVTSPDTTPADAIPTVDEMPSCATMSLKRASDILPGPEGDAQLLLLILCFLASSNVSLHILTLGGTPRKRWTQHGQIEEVAASCVGLVPALEQFLSDSARLMGAVGQLERFSAVSTSPHNVCISYSTRTRLLHTLPSELHQFWRAQALIVIYRSALWKSLEPVPAGFGRILLPHLKYTLDAVREHDELNTLPLATRKDLALSVLQSSRFSGGEWKHLAVARAVELSVGLEDPYVDMLIAQRQSLSYRLTARQGEASEVIDSVSPACSQLDGRMHSAAGYVLIERAKNHFQKEELAAALRALNNWQPLYGTPAELAADFSIGTLYGKILRMIGRPEESLASLESRMGPQYGALVLDEDRGELVCELADTLRELGDFARAEELLQIQLACPGNSDSTTQLLTLSLAESFFAQGKLKEADEKCSSVKSGISKMARLRLCITRAKLHHLRGDLEGAFAHWTDALIAVNRFPPTSGRTTRIIYLSICDILHRQGKHELEQTSRNELARLETHIFVRSEATSWIPGLNDWLTRLESGGGY